METNINFNVEKYQECLLTGLRNPLAKILVDELTELMVGFFNSHDDKTLFHQALDSVYESNGSVDCESRGWRLGIQNQLVNDCHKKLNKLSLM